MMNFYCLISLLLNLFEIKVDSFDIAFSADRSWKNISEKSFSFPLWQQNYFYVLYFSNN